MLVVDDDERLLAAYERGLGRERTVLVARDSRHALALARHMHPDLAIVDLQLGAESGIDLIRALKADHPELCAILVSGYSSVESTIRAIRAGADDVIAKPVTHGELLARLGSESDAEHPIETPTLAQAQWEHVQRVLADCGGNVSLAARRLGMYRSTLQRLLRRHAPSA